MEYILQDIIAKVAMPTDCYILKTCDDTGKQDVTGRKIWKHKSAKHPFFLVWDSLHGEIEVFHQQTLIHLAVYFPNGNIKSSAVAGRRLKFRSKK
jgi:hypothetical protein